MRIHEIINDCAEKHGLSANEITGVNRFSEIVEARWDVIIKARKFGHTKSAIGRALNRDHTTIIHACKKMGVA